MSKQVIGAGIRGANVVVDRVEGKINAAIEKYGADQAVSLPNTAYFIPVIYGITGIKVQTLGEMLPIIEKCRQLLADVPVDNCWTPYLGPGLDSGMAALFAFDMEEALKYLGDDCPYLAC
ncbi:MAG: CO dehydrogenase/CO-methylating acetyl-CoA synthase complex subunit beta, partial [Deltaproteobacteria bacterium]|nr:CO dehydrogenase/CO-methylating acetyl-CoA synthase complex subunit beta [Candidatus Tharpella aukensis]